MEKTTNFTNTMTECGKIWPSVIAKVVYDKMSAAEVARLCGVPASNAFRWKKRGWIPATHVLKVLKTLRLRDEFIVEILRGY